MAKNFIYIWEGDYIVQKVKWSCYDIFNISILLGDVLSINVLVLFALLTLTRMGP